jgi:translation elongation factor EF-Tu-like GTPase
MLLPLWASMPSEITYRLQATISLFPSENGGRKKRVFDGYRPSFGFNTQQQYSGEIKLIDKDYINLGETARVRIKLLPARTIRKNLKASDSFTINEGNKAIGTGVIKKVSVA